MKNFLKTSGLLILTVAILFGCKGDEVIDPVFEQFNKDIVIIDNYLEQNNITAQIDERSGIRYVIHDQGTGLQFYIADSLTLSYVGSLLSTGVEFETVQSEKRSINKILSGILYSAAIISEGGSITAYMPSFYGYGNQAQTGIPANSVLIADVTFEKLHHRQLLNDINIIDDSLASWGIDALVHPSGIRYTLEQGTGSSPSATSNVTVNYSGTRLGKAVFDDGQNETFSLSRVISGWKVMIPEMKVGGNMTMYLPSPFGYGTGGSGSIIPPNAILVFDVELLNTN
jgi:FKBP-type peptidyl-prolyl cis-trans isomerase FkpA